MRTEEALAALKSGEVVDVSRVIGRTPDSGGSSPHNLRSAAADERQPRPQNG